jgi:hypothetical protein
VRRLKLTSDSVLLNKSANTFDTFSSEAFRDFMWGIQELDIRLSNLPRQGVTMIPDSLPSPWLSSVSHNLQVLKLSFSHLCTFDFRNVILSRLREVVLEHVLFYSDWQIDWLCRQGTTLRKIQFVNCPILMDRVLKFNCPRNAAGIEVSPSSFRTITWADIFHRLATDVNLVELGFIWNQHDIATLRIPRYLSNQTGDYVSTKSCPYAYHSVLEANDLVATLARDFKALKTLVKNIGRQNCMIDFLGWGEELWKA